MNWWDKDNQVWHPFTQYGSSKPPVAIISGKDALLFDVNGKSYIDAISSWWVNLWGHANPLISAAIKTQAAKLEQVIFAGFTHEPAVQLADALLSVLPSNQQKIFYSDNGSTAVEVALKMAVQYWYNLGTPKTKIIAFENGYHGDTFGSMSAGRSVFFKAFEPLLFEVIQIPVPNDHNIEEIKKQLTETSSKKDIAAFIFEPLIQGSAGMLMHKAGHLDILIETAQKNNILCITDEVMTGFGRTGKKFACDHLNNKPDIICLSKGITGGFMPLGATSCTQAIFDAFVSEDKTKTFFHGHSYTANPLACSAALTSLDILNSSTDMIQQLCKWQEELSYPLKDQTKIVNLRQCGTITAFEVRAGEETGYFNTSRDLLYDLFIERGVLLRPLGNTVYVMPPYCITKDQLQQVYNVIEEVLKLL